MKNSNPTLEELKKQFIIDKGKYEKEKLPIFIQRILNYCKIDSEGRVFVEKLDMTTRDKIIITLIARFLANKLDQNIKSEMSGDDISTILDTDKAVIFARLKDLADIKVITRLDKGTYEIVPYHIEMLLNEIDAKYQREETKTKKESKSLKKTPKSTTVKSANKTSAAVEDEFLEEIREVDKSNYTYVYNLPTVGLKTLAILNMIRKELSIGWVSSPYILKTLSEKFRIKTVWSTISVSLKELDQKAYVESRSRKGHSTAREYRIMKNGEDYLQSFIEKLDRNETTI